MKTLHFLQSNCVTHQICSSSTNVYTMFGFLTTKPSPFYCVIPQALLFDMYWLLIYISSIPCSQLRHQIRYRTYKCTVFQNLSWTHEPNITLTFLSAELVPWGVVSQLGISPDPAAVPGSHFQAEHWLSAG